MAYNLLFALLGLAYLGCSFTTAQTTPTCFPYKSATLPKDLSPPDVPPKDWWCPQSMAYGFQGFSYPLEVEDCSDPSNSFESMNADFERMKRDFGASIVRMYYPVCLNASVFENALKAGVSNDMAVIFQVWTNFGTGDDWKKSQQAIYDVIESSEYGPIAPYVVHSADFGSEPVYDGMDGGREQFVSDLALFKQRLNKHGIPAGISEIWDLRGTMSNEDGTGLGTIGTGVKANSDYCHAHIMPYYTNDIPVSQTWPAIKEQMDWLNKTVQLPTMITETQWAWGPNEHNSGRSDVGVKQYTQYWKKFDDECETFKQSNVGWFLHTWRGEGTFDMVYESNGTYVVPNWRPRKC
ncbi:glycoside hydrolase family 17 protein [Hypomontagnella monticulosa]|nr:glycoside hydrolase family 17 protein [Hypomontagnella monticulosa]